MDHTCELVYRIGGNNIKYGAQKGICRITGKESIGISFNEWVKDTFTDHSSLFPGTIISNEALFCFDECSDIVMVQSGKEKPQRFRTYRIAQYIDWYCVGWTEEIIDLLRFCTHIGKNTGDGWGAVLRWEVTEWPEDWSIRGPQNKLMRAVPLQQDKNGFMYGLRPSYWNPRHQFICKMPQIN